MKGLNKENRGKDRENVSKLFESYMI